MHRPPVRSFMSTLWHTDRILMATAVAMLAVFAAAAVGLLLDSRTVSGAPVWLKPAKFGMSVAIYCVTLAWFFVSLTAWPRLRRGVSVTTAAVFVLEVAIILFQAWRGRASHFNVETSLDAALFAVMGVAIAVQTIAGVFVAVALWRQSFADRAFGAALRAAMVISLAGAATGGLMTRPTRAQLQEAQATHHITMAGAHTVGAPDGGAGIPGTGWSREHGDLRVPHFFGLHAMQVLPLIALLAGRRAKATAARFVTIASASYAALFAILLFEALQGEPLVAPSRTTALLLTAWGLATLTALGTSGRRKAARSFIDSRVRV